MEKIFPFVWDFSIFLLHQVWKGAESFNSLRTQLTHKNLIILVKSLPKSARRIKKIGMPMMAYTMEKICPDVVLGVTWPYPRREKLLL